MRANPDSANRATPNCATRPKLVTTCRRAFRTIRKPGGPRRDISLLPTAQRSRPVWEQSSGAAVELELRSVRESPRALRKDRKKNPDQGFPFRRERDDGVFKRGRSEVGIGIVQEEHRGSMIGRKQHKVRVPKEHGRTHDKDDSQGPTPFSVLALRLPGCRFERHQSARR